MAGLKKKFTDIFELSPEVMLDLPLIMLVGQQQLYIENHRGIVLYNPGEIRVRIREGLLLITGQDLLVEEVRLETLSITGQICGLSYELAQNR